LCNVGLKMLVLHPTMYLSVPDFDWKKPVSVAESSGQNLEVAEPFWTLMPPLKLRMIS